MTGEELERSIKALFDHQAQLTTDISRLESSIEETNAGIRELKGTVAALTNHVKDTVAALADNIQDLTHAVTSVAMQAEADRQIINNSINRFERQAEADRQIINNRMDRFEHQAEADRQEMHTFAGEMRSFAASVTDAIRHLTASQVSTNERLTKLETRPEAEQ